MANDELLDYSSVSAEDAEVGSLLLRIEEGLREDQFIDFSLMIRRVVEAIQENEPGLANAIGSLCHLMVDEYQDVNPCQEELIRLLHQRSATLFVVGDDDQAIYAWRGADVRNIIDFRRRYQGTNSHTLSINFRSTHPIVEASDDFAVNLLGPSRIPKSPSASANQTPQQLGVFWFPNRMEEARWVANRVQDLLGTAYEDGGEKRGLTPADFAVLMRSTRTEEQDGSARHVAFTNALSDLSIPFSLEAGGSPFDRSQTQVLRSTFELLRNPALDRDSLARHFKEEVAEAYPHADFDQLVRVLSDWQRRVHRQRGSTRIRLYPQQLVYELLEAFGLSRAGFGDDIMRDIGLFSRMIMDVETVYMSVDSSHRFTEMLNFLQNAAQTGYDVSTDDVVQRPDAVTVSTVHKMKGLEFPCVFVVDVEANRFPATKRRYAGWLPSGVLRDAISRGAYQSTEDEEIRLFYTAATRAERYLYISGARSLPQAKSNRSQSRYALQIATHQAAVDDTSVLPTELKHAEQSRRMVDNNYPTSFSEIRYYLQCPKSYQFRERYGLNPVIPEMFGFGKTVHTSIQKLHELHPTVPPAQSQIKPIVENTFHLKHVPPSSEPEERPGAYENAQNRAVEIAKDYVENFGSDFERERQVEAFFEIPAHNCVISGSIDLLLHEDAEGNILKAEIIDFKTMEGGERPTENDDLDWTELSLQVQLYARAADQILGQNARTGSVHLLKDNQRIDVPITQEALDAALANVEWAVEGILRSDFPRRPHPDKCSSCDFKSICSRAPESFSELSGVPPKLHLPDREVMARAFSQIDEN